MGRDILESAKYTQRILSGATSFYSIIMKLFIVAFAALIANSQGLLGFGSKCVPVPSNLCARAYDDGGCRGWELDIPVGEQMLKWWDPVWSWYRNDIEQVSVRAVAPSPDLMTAATMEE